MQASTFQRALRQIRAHPELRPLFLLCFLLGMTYSFLLPFFSLFGTEEVGMTNTAFGVFMTVSGLGAIGFSTALARLSDTRWSRRSVVLLGSFAGTVGYTAYAFVRDPVMLTVIGALILGVAGAVYPQIFALARDILRADPELEKDAVLHMNVVRVCFAVAWTVGPAISAWILTATSFTGVFLSAASLYALFGVLFFLHAPQTHRAPAPPNNHDAPSLGMFVRRPYIALYFFGFCLYFACTTMGMMNLPLLIKGTLRAPASAVGIAYSVAPIFEVPLMIGVGFLALRFRVAHIIQVTLLLAAIYYAALARAGSPLQIYLIQILSAFIVSVMGGLAITFFQDFMPHHGGSATNLYANASRIGSTCGYLTFGILADTAGHRGVFALTSGLCLLVFALLALAGRMRERSARPLIAET